MTNLALGCMDAQFVESEGGCLRVADIGEYKALLAHAMLLQVLAHRHVLWNVGFLNALDKLKHACKRK